MIIATMLMLLLVGQGSITSLGVGLEGLQSSPTPVKEVPDGIVIPLTWQAGSDSYGRNQWAYDALSDEIPEPPPQSSGFPDWTRADAYFPAARYGFTCEGDWSRRLCEQGRRITAENPDAICRESPVLVRSEGRGWTFAMKPCQIPYFGALARVCPSCVTWEGHTLHYLAPQTWDQQIPIQDLSEIGLYVRSMHLTMHQFLEIWPALFLLPDMLIFQKTDPIPVITASEAPPEIPRWVRRHYGWASLAWVEAASRRLRGESWEEFWKANGYLPGDRSLLDMQYTHELRSPPTVRGIDDPNATPADLYWAERARHWGEVEAANAVVDHWLGIEHDATDPVARAQSERKVIEEWFYPLGVRGE